MCTIIAFHLETLCWPISIIVGFFLFHFIKIVHGVLSGCKWQTDCNILIDGFNVEKALYLQKVNKSTMKQKGYKDNYS